MTSLTITMVPYALGTTLGFPEAAVDWTDLSGEDLLRASEELCPPTPATDVYFMLLFNWLVTFGTSPTSSVLICFAAVSYVCLKLSSKWIR